MTISERLATTARRLRQQASEITDAAERVSPLRRGEQCDERMKGYLRSSNLQCPN